MANKYEIRSLIAHGGMGRVYSAVQRPIMRPVAIKVLQPKHEVPEGTDVFRRRFLLEAATIARLTHPHTVTLFDYGELEDGRLYMVMEYVRGVTLKELIRQERGLEVTRVIRIATQIGQALREAHQRGILHRDLKPSNVMVATRDGVDEVKVLDFGLAKILRGHATPVTEDVQGRLLSDPDTISGQGLVVGSPGYMAPEQIRGETVDARADIYSLGCVLYECLAGVPPFRGRNPIAVLSNHLVGEIQPFYEVRSDVVVPDELDKLVHTCLARDPDLRYATVDDVLKALRKAAPSASLLEGPDYVTRPSETPTTSAPRPTRSRVAMLLGMLFGLLLAVAAGSWWLGSTRAPAPPVASTRAPPAAPQPPPVEVPPLDEPAAAPRYVDLRSDPPQASVWLDGVFVDTTPVRLELSDEQEARRFTLRLDGYRDAEVVVDSDFDGGPVVLQPELPPTPTPRERIFMER